MSRRPHAGMVLVIVFESDGFLPEYSFAITATRIEDAERVTLCHQRLHCHITVSGGKINVRLEDHEPDPFLGLPQKKLVVALRVTTIFGDSVWQWVRED